MKSFRYISFVVLCIAGLGFSRESEIQKGTTITGACLFGTSWGISFLAGALVASEEAAEERGGIMTVGIPIAGPIIFSAKYGYQADNNPVIWAAYLGMSAAQATGAGLFIRGLIGDKTTNMSLIPFYNTRSLGIMCNYNF